MAGVLGMILAGGEGSRLKPLTETRTKPAVPFGGSYRLIDFALNNFVNADLMRIYVLTQFKSQSLYIHMKKGWNLSGITDRFIDIIPAQMRDGKRWYEGTADAIYQNLRFVEIVAPDQVCIFGSDHIYKMDIRQMLDFHRRMEAELTVSALRMPISQASQFGVIEVDENGKMVGFEEKPSNPKSIPGEPEWALVSMVTTSSKRKRSAKNCVKMLKITSPAMTLAKTSFRKCSRAVKSMCMTSRPTKLRERRNRPTGVMSEPSNRTGRHIWICSTKIQNFRYTTAAGRCTPTILLCRLRRLWMSKTRKSKSQIA